MTYIYDEHVLATDEIRALRAKINAQHEVAQTSARAFRTEERALCAHYNALLRTRRPSYPTLEHRSGLVAIASMIHADVPYGDHLGYPTRADYDDNLALPSGISFESRTRRINIYAQAPRPATGLSRLWDFSEEEIDRFRAFVSSLRLQVISEWMHDDGVAFVVAPASG